MGSLSIVFLVIYGGLFFLVLGAFVGAGYGIYSLFKDWRSSESKVKLLVWVILYTFGGSISIALFYIAVIIPAVFTIMFVFAIYFLFQHSVFNV